jgi:hypothetical protein
MSFPEIRLNLSLAPTRVCRLSLVSASKSGNEAERFSNFIDNDNSLYRRSSPLSLSRDEPKRKVIVKDENVKEFVYRHHQLDTGC